VPVLALHAYATHPMSYYGRGEVTSDFVGLVATGDSVMIFRSSRSMSAA